MDHILSKEDINEIAEKTAGFSGRDLDQLVNFAMQIPIKQLEDAEFFKIVIKNGEQVLIPQISKTPEALTKEQITGQKIVPLPLQKIDFIISLDSIKPSVSKQEIIKFDQFQQMLESGMITVK